MPTPSEQSDDVARAAKRLRAARDLVERHAPAGRDRDDVLLRLDRLAASLERREGIGTCRRCGGSFAFDPNWFSEQGLRHPRHCVPCRRDRRAERERAGVTGNVPPEV